MNLIVSLHDVHPGSLDAIGRQRADLRQLGVRKLSLLVVPHWHAEESIEAGSEFARCISQWQEEGDEVVLHGWTHSSVGLHERAQDWFWTKLYTSSEAEFRLLTPEETRIRLTTGRELFDRLGWPCVGFIAPAWLLAPHTVPILRELGFAYTVTRKEIVPLADFTSPIRATSLCYSTRSGWRREASKVWNPSLAKTLRHQGLMRLSLHPGDIAYPSVWRQILRLTETSIGQGRHAQSYRDFVALHSANRPLVNPFPQ